MRLDKRLNRPPVQNPSEHITAPEDAMQIDLVPELHPSIGYQNTVSAMDVFLSFLFAYPTTNQDGRTVFRVIFINIRTKHAYFMTAIISYKRSAFVSQVIKEVAGVLGISPPHAYPKHTRTIGMFERTHASLKKALKVETSERRSMRHNYVNIAVLNYNTTYHTSIVCEPSPVVHRPVPYKVLDLKRVIRPQKPYILYFQNAQDVFGQTEIIYLSRCTQRRSASPHQPENLLRQKSKCFSN